jgi:hypothetical protein
MYYSNNLNDINRFKSENEAKSSAKNKGDVAVVLGCNEYNSLIKEKEDLLRKVEHYESVVSSNNLESELVEKKLEIDRLSKSLEGHKKAVGKWKDKLSGEKGLTKNKTGTNITYLQFNFIPKKDFSTKIIIETKVPINMDLLDVKDFFENSKVGDIFPELDNSDEYVISEVFCGKKKDVWSVVLIKY